MLEIQEDCYPQNSGYTLDSVSRAKKNNRCIFLCRCHLLFSLIKPIELTLQKSETMPYDMVTIPFQIRIDNLLFLPGISHRNLFSPFQWASIVFSYLGNLIFLDVLHDMNTTVDFAVDLVNTSLTSEMSFIIFVVMFPKYENIVFWWKITVFDQKEQTKALLSKMLYHNDENVLTLQDQL